jgi:hypothetical protein
MARNWFHTMIAGWRSTVSRLAHNQQIVGSNPTPATKIPIQTTHRGGASDRRTLGRVAERREIPSSSRHGFKWV